MRILFFLVFIFPLVGSSQGDTLNRVDFTTGKKTGYWKIYGKDKQYSGFADYLLFEEGNYIDGRKNGKWIQYYQNQNLKSEIEFKDNRPNGKFKLYYENGDLEEKGSWSRHFHIDSFYRYYPGLKLAQQRFFNSSGKSQGWQTLYEENGEIALKFYAHSGKEILDSGIVGTNLNQSPLISGWKLNPMISNEELCFCDINKLPYPYIHQNENGDSVVNYSKSYYTVRLVGKFKSSKLYEGNCYVEISNEETKLHTYFIEAGQFKKKGTESVDIPEGSVWVKEYNQSKQIEYDGIYYEGKFYAGKKYHYDSNGLLERIEVYKEGKFVGEAQKE